KAIRQADLPPYRIALTSQIIRAAGFAGWVILLDELELIGKYSPLQRAKSYGQLARWLGGRGGLGRSVVAIGAITSDFSEAVLDNSHGRGDRDRLPTMLRQRGADEAA